MASSEQLFPQPFIDFLKENPYLFEPLKDIPATESVRVPYQTEQYEPANDNERRLLLLIQQQENQAGKELFTGSFDTFRAIKTEGHTLIAYRWVLGRILGKPLEGGVKVGINTGIGLPNEFDGIYNVLAIINADGRIDRSVTTFGFIYTDLLSAQDSKFVTEQYFPIDRIKEILKPS